VVWALAVFDDGTGPALYAGGEFGTGFLQPGHHITKWNGTSWEALGSGINGPVRALGVFDDGSGPALYAGGYFTTAGGQPANSIARWDGQSWTPLAGGVVADFFSGVSDFATFDDGSGAGAALFVGGAFVLSDGSDSYLAKWGCPVIETLPGCLGNPAVLQALSKAATVGGVFDLSLTSSLIPSGLALLFMGQDGTDALGCGLLAPGLGELLLGPVPTPLQLASGSLAAGVAGFSLAVPAQPALVGAEAALQGFALAVSTPGVPIESSNALLVTLTQ